MRFILRSDDRPFGMPIELRLTAPRTGSRRYHCSKTSLSRALTSVVAVATCDGVVSNAAVRPAHKPCSRAARETLIVFRGCS